MTQVEVRREALSESPIYDALVKARDLAISAQDMEYTSQFLENGRNNLVEAMGAQDSPDSQEVIDGFLDREFGRVGLIRSEGRHADTSHLINVERRNSSEVLRVKHALEVGNWIEYIREQERTAGE
ncbi:MAG TPA: hypothetical protein VFS65_01310 [Candidatus Saccharimonadales bacterium]|nr:hypothetical protein [Candidatus Saccharimonadales bacterium]